MKKVINILFTIFYIISVFGLTAAVLLKYNKFTIFNLFLYSGLTLFINAVYCYYSKIKKFLIDLVNKSYKIIFIFIVWLSGIGFIALSIVGVVNQPTLSCLIELPILSLWALVAMVVVSIEIYKEF